MHLRLMSAVAVGLVFLTGCGPVLKESRSYTLDPDMPAGFQCPKQSKPQKITIEYTSSAAEVTVLLFKASDVKDDDNMPRVDAALALGKETGMSGKLTVDVPENTETWFVVRGAKKATKVDVKVTNR